MLTIWKFPFEIADSFTLQMPLYAEIVLVDVQGGVPCMWAKVDPHLPTDIRRFHVSGTGHEVPPGAWHLGSFQMPPYVWHLWGALDSSEERERRSQLSRLPRHRPTLPPIDPRLIRRHNHRYIIRLDDGSIVNTENGHGFTEAEATTWLAQFDTLKAQAGE